MLNNVLVLSPHRDDECLGLGGTLPQCEKLHIHYFNNHHPLVEDTTYEVEAQRVANMLGCTTSYSDYMQVNKLDQFPIAAYINEIETLINQHRPKTIFIPFPDYNQDHRVVYEAAITATRVHDQNWFVPNVLLYEQPCVIQTTRIGQQFIPQVYIPIDLGYKLELYTLYRSQQRHHRNLSFIRALAEMRGMNIVGEMYAEAFMVVRLCQNI